MRTTVKTTTLLLAALLFSSYGSAQEQITIVKEERPEAIVFVTMDKADNNIKRLFEETQSQWFQDPKAPRFLLMDREGKFALGIGGHVKGTTEVDFGGITKNIDFYPSQISTRETSNYGSSQYQMDISSSTLFLKMVGTTELTGDFVLYTAADFRGPNNTFRLRNAYASFLGLTVGYDFGAFMDVAALPPTIDGAGPSGSTNYRTTQINYIYKKLPNWQFSASIEMPVVEGITNEVFFFEGQRVPTIPVAVQYNWNPRSHFRAGAVLRSMSYDNDVEKKSYSETGWGVQASTMFNIGQRWQTFGQFTYGKGIGQYISDIAPMHLDLVDDPNNEAKMQVLPMMGWYAGLQYNILPNLFLSGTFSVSRQYSENGYAAANPDAYRMGQYIATNAFWDATPDLRIGVEYLRGWRTDFTQSTNHSNRANLVLQYSF